MTFYDRGGGGISEKIQKLWRSMTSKKYVKITLEKIMVLRQYILYPPPPPKKKAFWQLMFSAQYYQFIFLPTAHISPPSIYTSYIFPQYWHRIFSAQNWQLIFTPVHLISPPPPASTDILCCPPSTISLYFYPSADSSSSPPVYTSYIPPSTDILYFLPGADMVYFPLRTDSLYFAPCRPNCLPV